MTPTATASEPLLRSLAPMLRELDVKLRACLAVERQYKFDIVRRNELSGIADELRRRSEELAVEKPLLVVMLMGGTGVGKSTLLNALAGAPIAQASFTRPTTRDPVVYFHESIRPERLAPALRACRLQQHGREDLAQKVIVDTPDLDSTELGNREKLVHLLPLADIVLYVGSQEKYHDKLGWDLFREERLRRAFAFVLNKWDRCLHPGAAGLRPDQDLLLDLEKEGFKNPLLFRTSAQRWLDRSNGQPPADLPDGEQFTSLTGWLETGLTRLEIEAVKARGVQQLLASLSVELQKVAPPDLTAKAEEVRKSWERIVDEDARANTTILLDTLEPHQAEIETHFSVNGQRRFWGLMLGYLKLFTGAKNVGSTLRDKLSIFPKRTPAAQVEARSTWDVSSFTRDCTRVAGERFLDNRITDLTRRLQVDADERGVPLRLIERATDDAGKLDWRKRHEMALHDALQAAEQVWDKPTGTRRVLQAVLVNTANVLPNVTLIAAYLMVLWRYFMEPGGYEPKVFDLVMPLALTLIVMVLMQVLITLLLPMRWAAIRGEFQRQLAQRLEQSFADAYLSIPGQVAKALEAERRQIEELRGDVDQVARWLQEREQKANITGLYGSPLGA
jgi:hypothetical protein